MFCSDKKLNSPNKPKWSQIIIDDPDIFTQYFKISKLKLIEIPNQKNANQAIPQKRWSVAGNYFWKKSIRIKSAKHLESPA